MDGTLLLFYVGVGLILVVVSALSRIKRAPFDAETRTSWRFVFFAVWTLSLPLFLLWDWWGSQWNESFGGNGWKPPESFKSVPHWTYGRKVVSDVWAAVAVVLAGLSWNKPGGA
jgi:hypothetical protein